MPHPAVRLLLIVVLAGALTVTPVALGSQRWTLQNSGSNATLRGVSAATDRVAWASGSRGTILRTADGGVTWQARPVPETATLDFRDVDALDADTAFVLSIGAGPLSRIYRTTDAGATWTLQFRNEDEKAFYDAMAFADAAHGVVVSDSVDGAFVIRMTTDGGATWPRVPPDRLPAAQANEGFFAASGTNVTMLGPDHVWFGTGAAARARVGRTTDGGATWQVVDTPIASGQTSGIYSIAFRDAMNGLVVGGDYNKEGEAGDNIAVTRDGGATWRLVRRPDGRPALSGFRSVVAWLPGTTTVVAIGPSGTDVSTDDGETWAPIQEGPGFHTFSFVRPGNAGAPGTGLGWAAGSRGRIATLTVAPDDAPAR